jgi:hypothetical protein
MRVTVDGLDQPLQNSQLNLVSHCLAKLEPLKKRFAQSRLLVGARIVKITPSERWSISASLRMVDDKSR